MSPPQTSQWRDVTLSEVVTLQRGLDLPHADRRHGPWAVLGSNGPVGWHDAAPVGGPGVVIGRASNLGRPTWWRDDFWPLNTTLYVKDYHGNDRRFVYYLFGSLDLSGFNSGSVQPMLNRNYIAAVPVALPPLGEQRAIADILGALDDKIESNGRSAHLLDDTLRALFVMHCAPTQTGTPLLDLAEITKGVSYRSVDLAPSRTAMVTLKSVDRNGGYKANGLKPYVGPFRPSQVLTAGELAVAQTDLTQGAEVVGRVIRVPATDAYSTLVASLDLLIVRPRDQVPPEYLYAVLLQDSFRQHCRRHTSGTTVLHLASDALARYEVPDVAQHAQVAFANDAKPVLDLADALGRQNATLAALRDALLPELLSGRLRVPEAREQVESVV